MDYKKLTTKLSILDSKIVVLKMQRIQLIKEYNKTNKKRVRL